MRAPAIDPGIQAIIEATAATTLALARAEGAMPPIRYINSQQAAERIGVKFETLASMRSRGLGPEWSGSGRFTRYEISEVDRWLGAQPRASSEEVES